MKPEIRYVVLKISDLMSALSEGEMMEIDQFARRVNSVRKNRGKGPLEYLVIEKDWPEYEPTWKTLKERIIFEQGHTPGLHRIDCFLFHFREALVSIDRRGLCTCAADPNAGSDRLRGFGLASSFVDEWNLKHRRVTV